MVSLFLFLGCNLSYIVDLFAALHELASASARTLLKLASLLNNWRPKDNFRFDPISDRQVKNHLVCNNFCAAVFVLLFLYFKSRGQISRVKCTVVTTLTASGKLVPSTLRVIFRERRESEDTHEKSIFLLFRQNIPLGELIQVKIV